jgi:hypothetical protein
VEILFLVGLTGVGKSTLLPALLGGGRSKLPDRRELTDKVILPAALRLIGEQARPVTDRIERFRMTARYRETHPEGIVHALVEYLSGHLPAGEPASALFDGLRGAEEVQAALRRFPDARFLLLDASLETRVERLLARSDEFDRQAAQAGARLGNSKAGANVGTSASPTGVAAASAEIEPPAQHLTPPGPDAAGLTDRLRRIHGASGALDLEALALRWQDRPALHDDVVRAIRIVVEEQRHYDQRAARSLLETLPSERRLIIGTDAVDAAAVRRLVEEWL